MSVAGIYGGPSSNVPLDSVPCKWEGCPVALPKHDIIDHAVVCEFRKIPCSLGCGLSVPLRSMTEHAFTSCMNAKILCWQGCGAQIERGHIQRHIDSECGKTIISCPLAGCNTRISRDDLVRHLNSAIYDHTMITVSKIVELENRIQQLEGRLADGARTISQQADTLRRQEQQLTLQNSRNIKNSVGALDDMDGWRQIERKEDVANVLAVVADDETIFDAPSSVASSSSAMGINGLSLGSRSEVTSPSVQQYEHISEERGVEGVIAALCMNALDPHSQEVGMKVLQNLANNGEAQFERMSYYFEELG